MFLLYGLIFVWGIVLGSAANALIDRLPKKESWIKGRSKCDTCGHKLKWQDLIPLVSYMTLNGKCRYCRSPIAIRNSMVELFCGMALVLIAGPQLITAGIPGFLLIAAILWVTLIMAVMDWETMLVSEAMIVIWAVLVLSYELAVTGISWNNPEGLVTGVAIIGGIWLITRGRAMGEGDIEIAAVMGWWLGWEKTLIALWLAFILGSVVGLWKMARGRAHMKSEIAFGPFLFAGTWLAWYFGHMIWSYIVR